MNQIKRLLILSDSMAAPRQKPEKVTVEMTWPKILSKLNPDLEIQTVAIGHATTEDLAKQTAYWTAYDPDLTLIQVGLCDCLPRAFRKWEQELLACWFGPGRAAKLAKPFVRIFRKYRGIRFTNERQFKKNAHFIAKRFPNSYWLKIIPGLPGAEVKLPGQAVNVKYYNQCLVREFGERAVDLSSIEPSDYTSDNFHLNGDGHRKVAGIASALIESKSYDSES